VQARRYFGDGHHYASVQYGMGASPFEIRSLQEVGVLNSSSISSDVNWIWGNWLFTGAAGWAREERVNQIQQFEYNLGFTIARRF
jgi:hypothetical protein